MTLPSESDAIRRLVMRGWTGTYLENWITNEFFKVITDNYPEGEYPQ